MTASRINSGTSRMIRLRCLTPKWIGIGALISLVLTTIYYLNVANSASGQFPTEQFLLRWNASPYCGESLSKRIHLMYGGQQVPKAYEAHIRSWSGRFPGFELHFWTDSGIEKFLSSQYGEQMIRFFRSKLAHGVERSDVSRLLIVNHFGGLYADLDVMALQSAEPLMKNHSVILTEEPLPHAVFLYDRSSLISNAIVYSTPCHEFWRYYFKYYPAYLETNYGGNMWNLRRRRIQRSLAVYATGPLALDKFARQFVAAHPPLSSFESVFVAPPVNFQPQIDAAAPGLRSLTIKCRSDKSGLSTFQRSYCKPFLVSPDNLLLRTNQSVSYTRHDFLHLGYWDPKTETVDAAALLPAAAVVH